MDILGGLCLGAGGVMILLISLARRDINMIRFSGILRVLILGRFQLLRRVGWADYKKRAES
jgi:hypothetical protein